MATKVIATMREQTHRIVGTDAHLRNVLATYHARGDLVTPVDTISARRIAPGMSEMTVVLRQPVAEPTRSRRAATATARFVSRNRAPIAWTAAGVAFVTFVLWLAVYTITWFVDGALSLFAKLSLGGAGATGVVVAALLIWAWSRRTAGAAHGGHSGEGFHWSKCK